MPFYSIPLTIQPSTPATDPAEVDLQIFPGVITHVWLQFPKGCAGLVHVRILRTTVQIWPTNENSDISSDGFIVDWADQFDMTDRPLILTLSGYNLDDTFSHTITLWVEATDEKDIASQRQTVSMLQKFLQLVGVK